MLTLSLALSDGKAFTMPVTRRVGGIYVGGKSQTYIYPQLSIENQERLHAIDSILWDTIVYAYAEGSCTGDALERDDGYAYWQFALNGEPATYSEMYAFLNQ